MGTAITAARNITASPLSGASEVSSTSSDLTNPFSEVLSKRRKNRIISLLLYYIMQYFGNRTFPTEVFLWYHVST